MTLKACLECGEPGPESRCPEHRLPSAPKKLGRLRGYDTAWRKLSERARRLQPWCLDCGATDDLTADHLPEAWRRREQGKPVRLEDVDVVCRSCNSKRGAARGEGARDRRAAPAVKADFATLSLTLDRGRR